MQSSSNFTPDRWGIIKNWLEDNQADIVLVVGVILIALISFGLGRLSAPGVSKEPVVIEQNNESRIMNYGNGDGSVLNSMEQGSGDGQNSINSSAMDNPSTGSGNNNSLQAVAGAKGIFVASKNGTKYHWPWCSFAKKIKLENQVWFQTETEAQKARYAACGCVAKSPPAGYKPL